MATIRLVPSTYYLSNSSYLSVSNVSNMYNNTDNETYATVTNSRSSTSSYYIYVRGFNFDDVPSSAVVNSITIKLKARETGVSTSSSYAPYLANGTSTISGSFSVLSTSVQTLTCSTSLGWDNIKDYGDNFGIRINCRRASRNTTSYVYIYGAEILVDYTLPIARTITTSGVGCTVIPDGTTTVYEGDSFRLDITSSTSSLTVLDNGTDVTDQLIETPSTATIQATPASYSTSGSISGTYYQNAIGKGSDTSSTTGNNYASGGSSSTAYIDYSFDLSAVPTSATITSVVCSVKGHMESSSSSSEVARLQLYSGSVAKGDSVDFESTSDAVVTVGSGSTWTRDELDDLVLRFTIGYYGGNVSGATLSVTYEIESSGYNYYYLIDNVTGDHTIVVTAGATTSALYIKLNGTWAKITKTYQKVNGVWSEISYSYDSSKKLIYRGDV